jgi:hypothetical protein
MTNREYLIVSNFTGGPARRKTIISKLLFLKTLFKFKSFQFENSK